MSQSVDPAGTGTSSLDVGGPVSGHLAEYGSTSSTIQVRLTRELITLLSEQLYSSPHKAIEELVVNSFDADAPECYVSLPAAEPETAPRSLAIIDNGVGMDAAGLSDLWRVGASTKRDEAVQKARKRTQIGKFGIGKLATYAIANQITYISSDGSGAVRAVSLSFDAFRPEKEESESPIALDVFDVDPEQLAANRDLAAHFERSGLDAAKFMASGTSWTVVVLEGFKPQLAKLSPGRLRRVLATAMPLRGFSVYLDGELVEAAKATGERVVDFEIGELPDDRVAKIASATGVEWKRDERTRSDGSVQRVLVSEVLPSGIGGEVIVARRTLYGGKSADLMRSHGYFVRVRDRLIAESDPQFGLTPQSFSVFYRFRADVDVDDLDTDITAPREGTAASIRMEATKEVLLQVFQEGRERYEQAIDAETKGTRLPEHERSYVNPRSVEGPLADALTGVSLNEAGYDGSDADGTWFYLKEVSPDSLREIVDALYEIGEREPYIYAFEQGSREDRLVEFDPTTRRFVINTEHEVALAYSSDPHACDLLQDVAAAEVLLEVYLRQAGTPPQLVGEILERRDVLLRSLARDQLNTPAAIASALRAASADEHELEITQVVAARALGFVAKHVGNGGNPDGIARLIRYGEDPKTITLEAKSSATTPELGSIDFAGLREHVEAVGASGCLLIAPVYPGAKKGDASAASNRAKQNRISCWTIDQLARVVESAETRAIDAEVIVGIVEGSFAPDDVAIAVDNLLAARDGARRELSAAIVRALRVLETEQIQPRMKRNLGMLGAPLAKEGFDLSDSELEAAVTDVVAASRGGLVLRSGGVLVLRVALEELERRLAAWAGNDSSARSARRFARGESHRTLEPEHPAG